MLKKIRKATRGGETGRYAIVAARYNSRFTDALVRFAKKELGGAEVFVVRVPGAFEVPVLAAKLARSKNFDALICFGAILRGATTHAEHIALGVTNALAQLATETEVPIVHGVLMFENEEQAAERCLRPETNRGIEAARTAREMVGIMQGLNRSAKTPSTQR